MNANFDREEVRRGLLILYPPGHGVIELDILKKKGILPGHFDDLEKLLDEVEKYDSQTDVIAIYTALNQIKPEAFKRPDHQLSIANRVASGLRIDAMDVGRVTGILFDIDPFRINGNKKDSTTNDEHQASIKAADFLKHKLSLMGWPEPVMGSSGNGATLRYLTDLPAAKETESLLQRMLKAANGLLPEHLSAQVEVDGAMFDRPRISKVFGTTTRKGAGTSERPHRRSQLISAPEKLEPVQLDCIMKLIAAGKKTESDDGAHSAGPQREHEAKAEPLSSDAAERLQELFSADPTFKADLTTPAPAGKRSDAEFRMCARLCEAGFNEAEIYAIMTSSLQTKWQERGKDYRWATIRSAVAKAKATHTDAGAKHLQEMPKAKAEEHKKRPSLDEFYKLGCIEGGKAEAGSEGRLNAMLSIMSTYDPDEKELSAITNGVSYGMKHGGKVDPRPYRDLLGEAEAFVAGQETAVDEPTSNGLTVIDAIKALAGVCDGAKSQDGMGFSKFDRETHDALIKKIVADGELSRKEENTAYALAKKYRKQLKKLGIDYDQIGHIARDGSAAREDAGPTDSEQREIIVTNRHMQDITAESLPELVAYNNPPKIFVKAGYLVQIAVDEKEITRIEILGESALKSNLSRCARYMRVANEEGDLAATDAPGKVVKDVMALPNWPGILPIVGLISSPVVRPDGSIIDQPGHDGVTGLFYTGDRGMALTVPDSPTQEEAVNAAAYILTEVFGDFPFREQASRANTLAALLTTLTLPLIGGNIPLGLFDKPQAGTGASLLTEIIAELVTGEKANMQTAPDNDEEWRKAITAVLMQGPQIVVIDNVTSALKSSKLSQMLTARTWSDRMLSQTKMLNLPQTAAWFATGNNIQLGGDIARRSYWIRLDAASARPWLRDGFRHHDILAWVEEHRSELLSMLLTMVRAWTVAGKPEGIAPKIGSFENWSQVIGGILTFAKVEGFLGNAAELYDSADQDIAQWDLFLDEWQKLHRDDKITSGTLKIELTDIQPIYKPFQSEMPEEIIKATDKGTRGAVGLGKALSRHVDQVFPSGRKLTVEVDSHTKGKKWSVTTIKRSAVDAKGTETQASDPFAVDAVVGLTPSQNQKGNISGMGEREEKSGIITERNGGGGGSNPASTAKRPDNIECGTLPSTANGDGPSPAQKEDHGFTKFKKSMAKRVCYFCGRTFPYDLTPFYNAGISGYQCVTCHMDGPPPASMPIDAQIKLSEVKT